MKKILFAAVAALFVFTSCNKEDNGIIGDGQDAKLIVNVANPSSKATGAAATSDNTITGYEILVFDASGNNIGYEIERASCRERG